MDRKDEWIQHELSLTGKTNGKEKPKDVSCAAQKVLHEARGKGSSQARAAIGH
jgi:hypothetical protein